MSRPALAFGTAALALAACQPLDSVGRAPAFTAPDASPEHAVHYRIPMPDFTDRPAPGGQASLWSSSDASLLGDRRASRVGDILTVVIEINDSAEISNATARGRTGSSSMAGPTLFGIPQLFDRRLPGGVQIGTGMDTSGGTSFSGNGSVSRKERMTLRVASTVVEKLPNGVLRLEGRQEVRVNHELRELLVTGFVRPTDISRQNEVTYDKIAGARISYGGRGIISNMQQPRYGTELVDLLAPF